MSLGTIFIGTGFCKFFRMEFRVGVWRRKGLVKFGELSLKFFGI